MVAESSELPEVAERNQPGGEAELTLEGGDCCVTVRGPERASEEPTEWAKALLSAYDVWRQMYATVHAGRLEEIRAEQSGPVGSGSAGFIQESSPERRNQSLPGGTGARPV